MAGGVMRIFMRTILLIAAVLFCLPRLSWASSPAMALEAEGDRALDPNEQLSCYSRALAAWSSENDDEDKSQLYLRIGYAYVALENYPKALENIDYAASLDAENFSVHNGRGLVLAGMNRCREAISEYGLALGLAPASMQPTLLKERGQAYADCLKDNAAALKDFGAAIAGAYKLEDKDLLAFALIDEGKVLCREKKFTKAFESISQGISFKPADANLYYEAGICREIKKDWRLARDNYAKSIKLAGPDTEKFENQAVGEKKAGAITQTAHGSKKKRADCYFRLGLMNEKLHNTQAAKEDYQEACSYNLKAACRALKRPEGEE